MEMKPLGDSGLEVSSVGIGCMMFGLMCDQDQTTAIVNQAIEEGINFFDTADIYGGPHGKSETLLGKALGNRRSDVIIGTKFGAGGGGGAPFRLSTITVYMLKPASLPPSVMVPAGNALR